MSEKLSLLDDSSDSDVELNINKNYASSYNTWRNKEELQKYKDLKKEDDDSESSSESEEEVPEFDEEFFRALSLVKGKDPRIYDKNFELFTNKEVVKKSKPAKQKGLFMKDYERNLVLERGGKFSDEDEEEEQPVFAAKTCINKEQMENLKSLKEAVGDSDSDDDLLQERTKTKTEQEAEEQDYVKWLKGEEKEISEDVKKDMSYLRDYWNDPKLDEDEKFLRDYILNKRYLEKDDSEIPTYEELTSGMLSDDEKVIDEQEKFEHKYNFRFEEPDEEFIKRYPRTIGDSLRRADTRRKQKREEIAERKRKEKEQRQEELKRLKALKRKEIEEKFMKLKEISGQEEINLNESDIESDFDPDKHDQKMREMFNEDYYQVEEDQKPEFPFDEELDEENWNTWSREKCSKENDDDEEEKTSSSQNDEEADEEKLLSNSRNEFADEMINASVRKKKGKKKSLFAKVISQTKPIYDPSGKSFEDYLDEYYKLDYEDVIGDMPVRYKYRKVVPNDFGLTVDEILTADDRELNRWCSVKKTCQYRNEDEEYYDVQAFQKKAQNPVLKKKVLLSVYAKKDEDDPSTNLGNQIGNEHAIDSVNGTQDGNDGVENGDLKQHIMDSKESAVNKKKSKKKKRKQNSSAENNIVQNSDHHDDDDVNNVKCMTEPNNSVQSSENELKFSKNQTFTSQSDGPKKKSRKKKRKEKQQINLNVELGSENAFIIDKTGKLNSSINNDESSEIKDNHRKSTKRKRDDEEMYSPVGNCGVKTEENEGDGYSSPKSKRTHASHADDTEEGISNSVVTSETASKKKRKKKKKKRKGDDTFNKTINASLNKSGIHQNKSGSKKHKQFVPEDKRLALSDERLAAYGINPKKFKSKIIYSGK